MMSYNCNVLFSALNQTVKLHTGYESFPNSTYFASLHANTYITSFLHTQHQWERDHCLTTLTTAQFKPQKSTLRVAATVCSNQV